MIDFFGNEEAWFDEELHTPCSDKGVDYSSVEAIVFRRVHECDELGLLGLLRADEMPSGMKQDIVESRLFSQIFQYNEYDLPVNECLKLEDDLSEQQWNRVARKLGEKLVPVVRRPLWEQQMMASCNEPSLGYWEAMESELFDRLEHSDELKKESWEQCEYQEEPVTASSLEAAEALLDEHIIEASSKTLWEQVLCIEQILPFGRWETVEDAMFTRIEKHQNIPVKKQPFWFILEHYSAVLKAVGVAGAAVGIAVIALTGFNSLKNNDVHMPTIVYQLEGQATDAYNLSSDVEDRCQMIDGGAAKLINSHGLIELANSSVLKVDEVTRNNARYRVNFEDAENSNQSGAISFMVRKQQKDQSFSVATDDYTIHVTGTYFRVESDNSGKTCTKVLEGSVRITSPVFGDTALIAGQFMRYDRLQQRYRIYTGGEVAGKAELERLPDIKTLQRSPVLTVTSNVVGAEVFIDNEFVGIAPLTVRQSAGKHFLVLRKKGYLQVDSSVVLYSGNKDANVVAFSLHVPPKEIVVGNAAVIESEEKQAVAVEEPVVDTQYDYSYDSAYRTKPRPVLSSSKTSKPVVPNKISEQNKPNLPSLAELYKEAQGAERAGNWKKAVRLYRSVLDHPFVTLLRREDALFSIGRLQAENGNDIEVAKESFLTYLALFPHGTFAGESWLRLAELEFQRNPENAIQYYLKHFQMFPQHPRTAELQDRVGMIYLQKNRYHKAIAMFDQALSNNRSTGNTQLQHEIAKHLYRALEVSGDRQRAEFIRQRYMLSSTR